MSGPEHYAWRARGGAVANRPISSCNPGLPWQRAALSHLHQWALTKRDSHPVEDPWSGKASWRKSALSLSGGMGGWGGEKREGEVGRDQG